MNSHRKNNELLSLISEHFSERVPFNKFLGLKVESMCPDCVKTSFGMRNEFTGNYLRGMLHGGVISSVLDATGGLAAFVGTLEKMQIKTLEELSKRVERFTTIDLRVDFLRPGVGEWFVVTAYTLKTGKKVVVTRIELHNQQNALIAVGIGTYFMA